MFRVIVNDENKTSGSLSHLIPKTFLMAKDKVYEFHMRHHRQQMVPGWRQDRLATATIGITGSSAWPASFFLASAVALGIRRFVVVCPVLDETFVSLSYALDSTLELAHVQGWLTHPTVATLFDSSSITVDFSQLGITNKILFNNAWERSRPFVTVRLYEEGGYAGFRLWTYTPGTEAAVMDRMISFSSLTADAWGDPATAMAAAGLALEEVKRLLFGMPGTRGVVEYVRPIPRFSLENVHLAVIGAGALGNFTAPTLALAGCRRITLMDPDRVDVTNLNRQIFFANALGAFKAPILAQRISDFFGIEAQGLPHAFDDQTEIQSFDALLDCVDNFESRILLSQRAQAEAKILVSGGTGPNAGQVVPYHPGMAGNTPANLLHMERFASQERPGQTTLTPPTFESFPHRPPRDSASCLVQPDPSVVMSNQIIGALMADALHRMLSGETPTPIFYESSDMRGICLSGSGEALV